MIQSSTPLFTLTTSVLLDGKRYNCWAYWAMIPVCGGGAICSFNEVNFSLFGSMLSISAVVFRALKTLLQGRLLCDQKVDSITLCYYMAPFNLLILGTASAVTEGLKPWRMLLTAESSFAEHSYLVMSLTVSSILACAFNILSYLTIKHLSPVGANVIANAKTPAIIFMSMLIFGNPVAPLQVLGLLVTFFGIFLHAQKGRTLSWRRYSPDCFAQHAQCFCRVLCLLRQALKALALTLQPKKAERDSRVLNVLTSCDSQVFWSIWSKTNQVNIHGWDAPADNLCWQRHNMFLR